MTDDEDPIDILRAVMAQYSEAEQRVYEDRLAAAIARADQAHARQTDAMRMQNMQMIWAAAASAAVGHPGCPDEASAALVADNILAEFKKRFP